MPTAKKTVKKADDVEEVPPAKIKKEFDLDGAEVFAADKADDAEVLDADSEDADELGDDVELDGEELNPFGDKWEE